MFGKAETIALLDQADIAYELYEHEAVFTVEQAHAAGIPHPELGAKNLFLRDDKHRAYHLVCLPDEKDVSLREVQGRLGSASRLRARRTCARCSASCRAPSRRSAR